MHCVSFWFRSGNFNVQFGSDNFPVYFDAADAMVQAKSSSEGQGCEIAMLQSSLLSMEIEMS